jgi:hypothetical protein
MTARAGIYSAIDAERGRQKLKWAGPHDWGVGDCSSFQVDPLVKLAVLGEEYGEVARALLEKDTDQLRLELIQLAAVAVAWSEALTDVEPDLFDGITT